MHEKIIRSIGHSTRSFEQLLQLLQAHHISLLADVRSFPGSKRLPHFNKDALETTLLKHGVNYLHLKDLGGRKPPRSDSKNTAWSFKGFRGYADHMETAAFKKAVELLEQRALHERVAFMCAEASWRNCHRSLLSDYLKAGGWQVIHILNEAGCEFHPYTKQASIINGQLSYELPNLFS